MQIDGFIHLLLAEDKVRIWPVLGKFEYRSCLPALMKRRLDSNALYNLDFGEY